MKIAISSDSTCAISQAEAKDLNIHIFPLNVIVDGQEYHDGITIDQEKLNSMMRGGSRIKTSTPPPMDIQEYFDKLFEKGYEKIIHFTISSKLSSMFSLFTTSCQEKYGDKIVVIDSRGVCSFMGNVVKHAKKLANENVDFDKIVDMIDNMAHSIMIELGDSDGGSDSEDEDENENTPVPLQKVIVNMNNAITKLEQTTVEPETIDDSEIDILFHE